MGDTAPRERANVDDYLKTAKIGLPEDILWIFYSVFRLSPIARRIPDGPLSNQKRKLTFLKFARVMMWLIMVLSLTLASIILYFRSWGMSAFDILCFFGGIIAPLLVALVFDYQFRTAIRIVNKNG